MENLQLRGQNHTGVAPCHHDPLKDLQIELLSPNGKTDYLS